MNSNWVSLTSSLLKLRAVCGNSRFMALKCKVICKELMRLHMLYSDPDMNNYKMKLPMTRPYVPDLRLPTALSTLFVAWSWRACGFNTSSNFIFDSLRAWPLALTKYLLSMMEILILSKLSPFETYSGFSKIICKIMDFFVNLVILYEILPIFCKF